MDPSPEPPSRRRACEECRRLKLRCDRKVPCHSCLRRGCASICPDGTFVKGARSLKTNSLKLHETITEMSVRIVQLEEALASLQSQLFPHPHPLLTDDRVKIPLAPRDSPLKDAPSSDDEAELVSSIGAFSIREKGEVVFHEDTANTEYLIQKRPPRAKTERYLSLPPDLVLLSVLFPFPPNNPTTPIQDFIPLLPTYDKAVQLMEGYFTNFAWYGNPIPREYFIRLVFNEIYPSQAPLTSLDRALAHRLALLFIVFALGICMDVNRPASSVEAEEYHTLSRACICILPVYQHPSLYAVQAMRLMISYYTLSDHRPPTGYRVAIMGVIIRLGQAIGLHHDTAKLNLDPAEAKLREITHWEVVTLDFWQAFSVGRPPSISFNTSHCKRPYDLRSLPDTPDSSAVAWIAWKHEYTYLLHTVIEQSFRSEGTTYSQIITLDKKLRQFPVPPVLAWPTSQEEIYDRLSVSTALAMQRHTRVNLQETSILHLHRRFFMRALQASPIDPLQHQFAYSVRAVFASACSIISCLWNIFQFQTRVIQRMAAPWSHGLSAAAALGSLIISSPTCSLARPALNELDRAYFLFQQNEHTSLQPEDAAPLLEELRHKAYTAMNEHSLMATFNFRADPSSPQPLTSSSSAHVDSSVVLGRQLPPWQVSQVTPAEPPPAVYLHSAEAESWRQYATPVSTPQQVSDDFQQVSIAPEERSAEQANWDSFMRGFA